VIEQGQRSKIEESGFFFFHVGSLLLGSFEEITLRTVRYILGMGLSTAGVLQTCGDWVYSGHTAMLVMAFLLINE
jgi:shingomyelin synthase